MIIAFMIESIMLLVIGIKDDSLETATFIMVVIGIFTLWTILYDIKKTIERGEKK